MQSYHSVDVVTSKSKRRKRVSRSAQVEGIDSDSLSSLSGEEDLGGKRRRKTGRNPASSSGAGKGHGHRTKRRKSKFGGSGKMLLRKYKNFQSCPVQVISLDPEKGCYVMYSDGEVELVSDEEALEDVPNSMLSVADEAKSPLEEHEHQQAGNLIVEFTGSSGITLDPRFVHKLIQHLSKAKYNMTPQKYATKIDEANFPKYPTTSFGLYLASSLERGEKGTLATGSEWAAMDPEEKRPYNEQHKVNMQNYRAAIEAYKPGPVEKVALDTFKKAKQECQRLAKKRLETGAGGTTKPKRPMSAFLYFSQEERARWMEDSSNDKSMRSFQAQAAVKWRSLADEDKNRFQQMASQDQSRYRNEMDLFQNDNPDIDPKKNIQKAYFDEFIHKRLKILRKLSKASTGALKSMRRRKVLEKKLQKRQRQLLKANQEHGRWSNQIHKIRDKFPSLFP